MDSHDAEATYYDLLGVTPAATRRQIRSAYRATVRHAHPDCNGGRGDPELLWRAREAYETLSDAESRRRYDLIMGLTEPEDPAEYCRLTFERLFDRLLSSLRMDWWERILRAMQDESA